MTKPMWVQNLAFFTYGIIVGGFFLLLWRNPGLRTTVTHTAATPHGPDVAAMQEDIAHLKELVPTQSHSMTDVGFQFSNLWFAGRENNWPLAAFFLNESRQHIRWTIRIRPIRKSPSGDPVDLEGIFDAIDGGVLVKLQQAIERKDSVQFVAAYKETLAECYSCHKASGKPFLRPMVPTARPQTIINFDPNAKWPK